MYEYMSGQEEVPHENIEEELEVKIESEPEPEKPKKEKKSTKKSQPLVALRSCNIELDECLVQLVKGDEVHGLSRAEREHLKLHGFIG